VPVLVKSPETHDGADILTLIVSLSSRLTDVITRGLPGSTNGTTSETLSKAIHARTVLPTKFVTDTEKLCTPIEKFAEVKCPSEYPVVPDTSVDRVEERELELGGV